MNKFFSLGCIVLISFTSCKKNNNILPSKTDIDFLVDKRWQVTDERAKDSTGKMHTGYWLSYPDYIKDDYTIWKSDYTYTQYENNVFRPDATGDVVTVGTWSYKDGNISMSESGNWKILSITDQSLQLEYYNSDNKSVVWYDFKVID